MNKSTILKPRSTTDIHIAEAGNGQLFLTASPSGFSPAEADVYTQIAAVLRERGAEIVHERIFGSLDAEAEVMAARKHALETQDISSEGPVTYIEGASPDGVGFTGVIIRAIVPARAEDVWTILDKGLPCGRGWRRNWAEFIVLQNMQFFAHPHLTSPIKGEESKKYSPAVQAQQVIERAERILREQGASYRDVVRTWFYLSDILDWYSAFNEVRNSKYSEFGIMPPFSDGELLLPASTGVGGRSPQKSAATMDLMAITGPADSRPFVKQLSNAGQLDAFCYGSAFSRGVLIRESDVTTIQISGTAAIDAQGRSLYHGDARSQIEYTLDQVEALLCREGAGLKDIAAATVFVERPEHAELFREIIAARGLIRFPAVCVVADICRAELLFEMDAEGVMENGKD